MSNLDMHVSNLDRSKNVQNIKIASPKMLQDLFQLMMLKSPEKTAIYTYSLLTLEFWIVNPLLKGLNCPGI